MKSFNIFVAGLCSSSAIYQASQGRAWFALGLAFVAGVNFYFGLGRGETA